MNISRLSPQYSVSAQIQIGDLIEIKRLHYDGVVCNRPDGEAADQPRMSELAQEAQRLGIDFIAIPMPGPEVSPGMMLELKQFLQTHTNVLAFCRSGNRSSLLGKAAGITPTN